MSLFAIKYIDFFKVCDIILPNNFIDGE